MPVQQKIWTVLTALMLTGIAPILRAESKCQAMASALNERFFKEEGCGNKPFYSCAGIAFHVVEGNAFMMMQAGGDQSLETVCDKQSQVPWCPNAGGIQRNVVSFSFLHKNITANYGLPVFPNSAGTAGFVFTANTVQNYLLCAYPVDAMSYSRQNCGCGSWGEDNCQNVNTVKASCEQNGVFTDTDFFNKYIANNHQWDIKSMCSFGKEPATFDAFLSSTQLIVSNSDQQANWNPYCNENNLDKCAGWNELVLKAWFDIPYKDIPIEAFVYVKDSHNLYPNSSNAKAVADKMANTFPRNVPVLELNIDNIYDEANGGPFFCVQN